MTLDELVARESIRDLVARYNSYGDSGKFELLFDLFVDDIVMEIRSATGDVEVHEGRRRVEEIFTGTQARVQSDEQHLASHIRHFTATHQIDLIDEDHASGRCYFAVIVGNADEARGLDHWGRYVDEYRRVDGRWKFARRRVHVDGQPPGSWFVQR